MAEIRWTEEAAIWLEDIHKYIAKDNPEAAGRVVEGIYDKVQIQSTEKSTCAQNVKGKEECSVFALITLLVTGVTWLIIDSIK